MILVTGATGFVGGHLVRALHEQGLGVRCLVRPGHPPAGFWRGVEVVPGDVCEPAKLAGACAGIASVIHLVAVIREKGRATFTEVNVRGTVNILEAAEKAGVQRFIYMSALGASADPAYRYAYSKWLAEEAVRKSSLQWTIFRPSLIYGEGFGFFDRLIQSLKMAPPLLAPLPGGGRTLFQPIAVEDLVRCVVHSLDDPSFYGVVCELGGPEHLSYAQMLEMVAAVLGTRRLMVPVPLTLLRLVVPLLGLFFKDPPVTPVELKQLDKNNITDLHSVEKMFGFKPRRLRDSLGYLKNIEETRSP